MHNIPDWFSLDYYRREMSLEDWHYQIIFRMAFFHPERWNEQFFDSDQNRKLFIALVTGGQSFRKVFPTDSAIIAKLAAARKPIKLCTPEHFREHFESEEKEINAFDIDPEEMERVGFDHESIIVNYTFSDQELLDAFKTHLKTMRKKRAETSKLSKPIIILLGELHDFNFLALFDLLVWRKISHSKITYTNIGDAVWPDDHTEIEQRIRKKGIPMIDAVLNPWITHAIQMELFSSGKKIA